MLAASLARATRLLRPPPRLDLIEWADRYRHVAAKTSASPGRWKTSAQPVSYGPMSAITDSDTHTVTVEAATQVVKTEWLLNIAGYFIHQDPAPILFVQPSQGAAAAFSKERFAPTVDASPVLRELVSSPKTRDSENTISHKAYPGGSLDFVGANSPSDLASRPKRIILEDEIDKYPPSAGAEGDPLKLAEERGSTYKALGLAKFARACSPTVEGFSRIDREYKASDQRRCFVACPHCSHEQILRWDHVRWDKDENGTHLPDTAALVCEVCGVEWSERDRIAALDGLATARGYGWRQTKEFTCCGLKQQPADWDHRGRSRCAECGDLAPYDGHAGFHVSKLYSKRHRLPEMVREFLEAQGHPDLLRKFTNTALAEVWKQRLGESFNDADLMARAESYGPDTLPDDVVVVTGFADVQGDRLEVQLIAWGHDEESWPFLYEIIHQDPAQPAAWKELEALLKRTFKTVAGRELRVGAFGIDMGGHHGAQVFAFCRRRRGRRIFACKGIAGPRSIWAGRAQRSKTNDPIHLIGVDTAKDAIMGRLKIQPAPTGVRKPGFIHFSTGENFGAEYYEQLTSEHRETRKRMGQPYSVWVLPEGKRNEALDTFVGALAVRRSLPRRILNNLEYEISTAPTVQPAKIVGGASVTTVTQPQKQKRSIANMLAR